MNFNTFVHLHPNLVSRFHRIFDNIIAKQKYYLFAKPIWLTHEIQLHIVKEHDHGHQHQADSCSFCISHHITTKMLWQDNTTHTIRACIRTHFTAMNWFVPLELLDPEQDDTVRRSLNIYTTLFQFNLADYCLKYLFFATRKTRNIENNITYAICILESLFLSDKKNEI